MKRKLASLKRKIGNVKYLLPRRSSMVIWGLLFFVYYTSCVVKDEDKIVTPEDPKEENTPDPNFNASDWILYR